jgi:hypothetical protein
MKTRESSRMADEYVVQLYGTGGDYVTDAFTDQDLSLASNREMVIDSGGKIYVWNQRNAQWRESAGVITLGKEIVKPAEPEPEPEHEPEPKVADKDK